MRKRAKSATLMLLVSFVMSACVSITDDERIDQRAFLIYGTYVDVLEEAAAVAADPSTPDEVRGAILQAHQITAPTMQLGVAWARQWSEAKDEFDAAVNAGLPPPERYSIITRELSEWLLAAPGLIAQLVTAYQEVRDGRQPNA